MSSSIGPHENGKFVSKCGIEDLKDFKPFDWRWKLYNWPAKVSANRLSKVVSRAQRVVMDDRD